MSFLSYLQQTPNLYNSERVFIAPHIPRKKIQGAFDYLPYDVKAEDIAIVVDDTIFGGAKEGLCVTATGIYFKALFCDLESWLFHQIHQIEADGTKLYINQRQELSFTQPSRTDLHILAQLIQHYLSQSQSQSQGIVLPREIEAVFSLYHYLCTFQTGYWNEACQTHVLNQFAKFDTTIIHAIRRRMQQHTPIEWNTVIKQLSDVKHNYVFDIKVQIVAQVLELLKRISRVSELEAKKFLSDTATALSQSRNEFDKLCKIFHVPEEKLPNDINEACECLNLTAEQLTHETVTKAYRKKAAEFHPDRYQQLPPSVQKVIEQQLQQCNHAREVLTTWLNRK